MCLIFLALVSYQSACSCYNLAKPVSRNFVSRLLFFLSLACGVGDFAGKTIAETLEDALRAANVPTGLFQATELGAKITSYAVSKGDPFLLAYYVDDGSGLLHPPLRVIRFDRAAKEIRRAGHRDVTAAFQGATFQGATFQGATRMDCLGSALHIREYRDLIYIETHYNPSAGCVIVLSSSLALKAALSGSLLGFMGNDYAILREGEVHFTSVHPLHIAVFDLKRNRAKELYPFKKDPERREFSRSIQRHISEKWCADHNAPCDPEAFDADLQGSLMVNEAASAFGFRVQFDAQGFGESVEKQVEPRTITYIFRKQGDDWDHKEYRGLQLQRLLGGQRQE